MKDQNNASDTNRVPTFSVPGLILLSSTNAVLACNAEVVRILAFPAAAPVNPNRVAALVEKLPREIRSSSGSSGEHNMGEVVSGRRRYLCSRYLLNMHGPQPLRTTAILLERAGSPDVTMHELCNRFNLTNRERQAVKLLVKGLTSKEIAQEMAISPNTVKSFLRLVMTKAGVSTRAGLIGKVAGISLHAGPPNENFRSYNLLRASPVTKPMMSAAAAGVRGVRNNGFDSPRKS